MGAMMRACFAWCFLLVLLASACGGSAGKAAGAGGATGGAGGGTLDAGHEAGPMCTVSDAPFGAAAVAAASCAATPPPGAPTPPAPKAYTGGTCPTLAAGSNTLMSTGNARTFLLALPSNIMPGESLPVIFLWYWLKGTSEDFYTVGDVQAAVDQQRFIAVIPDAKGDLFYNWPFTVNESQARVDEEVSFFDDMLSCVSAQFNVNASCVSTAGVSAGALFTDQLVGARSDYLSSFMSLSGGVAYPSPTLLLRPWTAPTHPLPAFVLWGGPDDECLFIEFQPASQTLEQDLEQGCEFMIECVHNCGHSEPPFTAAEGLSTYGALWGFALDHPYWLPNGTSPYTTHGLPAGMPSWCAIGAGNAVARTGPCNGPGC
jgi:predicted esterase